MIGFGCQLFSHSLLQPFARLARVGGQRLDQNAHRRTVVQSNAGAFDQAEAGGGTGDLGHQGRFTETHFPDPLAKAVIPGQFADPGAGAGGQLADRNEVFKGGEGGHCN